MKIRRDLATGEVRDIVLAAEERAKLFPNETIHEDWPSATRLGPYIIGYDPGDNVHREAFVVLRIGLDGTYTVVAEHVVDQRIA